MCFNRDDENNNVEKHVGTYFKLRFLVCLRIQLSESGKSLIEEPEFSSKVKL